MPNAGDTLSLGGLGYATGQNASTSGVTVSLNACAGGGSQSHVRMSQFTTSNVASVYIGTNTPAEQTLYTATVTFYTVGSRFLSRVANRTRNFYWIGHTNTTLFSFYNGTGWNQPYNDKTAWILTEDLCYDSHGTQQNASLKVYYQDNYNHHATNYGTYRYDYFNIQTA
jgi:hypothetical protein